MKRILFALVLIIAVGLAGAENITRWMIAGQSNAIGSGSRTTPARSRDTADIRVKQDYYGDNRRLIDPSSQQGGAGASMAPAFGSYLAAKYDSTEHILNFAVSGTSLVGTDGTCWGYRNPADHFDITTLYGMMVSQIVAYWTTHHCGIVWLQGESDADAGVSDSAYDTTLTHLIGWCRQDLGYTVPFIIIQIGRRPSGSDAGTAVVQTVDEKICNNTDIIYGCSTYDLGLQSDSSHFDFDGQDSIGKRAAIQVSRWIDGTLSAASRFRASSLATTVRKQINITTSSATTTAGKTNFELLSGTNEPPIIVGATGNLNLLLNTDLSKTSTLRYAYGRHPKITNCPKNADGFPLEPIHAWQTISPYSGSITSPLTFNDKDMDFMLYFARVVNKTTDQYSGNYPVYPSDVYTAAMSGMSSGEGFIYHAADSSYFLRTGATGKITLNKDLFKTATSRFTFAMKIRYGVTNEDYVTLFAFGSGTTMCQAYLRSITGPRAIDFSTYIAGTDVGYAQAIAASLPGTASDVFLCFVGDSTTLKIYVNGVECSYGFHQAYTGGTQTWSGLSMFNYSAIKCYWAAYFNDALSQARIDSLQAMPNDLLLYGNANGDTMNLSITALPNIAYSSPVNIYAQYTGITRDSCLNTGSAVDSFIISPALPTGLSLTKATGTISGTPTVTHAKSGYRVIAYNSDGRDTCYDTITVNVHRPGPMSYASSPAICSTGTKFTYSWALACSTAVLDSVKATSLPAGLTCSKATGTISGTPTTPAAKAGYKIKAWNISGVDSCYDTITTILGRPHVTYKRTAINSQKSVAIVPDSISNTGGTVDSFTIVGTLPTGFTFSKTTGIITGLVKDTSFYVKAWNATSTDSTRVQVRYGSTGGGGFRFGF